MEDYTSHIDWLDRFDTKYEIAAAAIGTTVQRLKAIDSHGPRCESSNCTFECIDHKCGWFTRCYPEFKNSPAKEWEYNPNFPNNI